jgi:hypothetical protein
MMEWNSLENIIPSVVRKTGVVYFEGVKTDEEGDGVAETKTHELIRIHIFFESRTKAFLQPQAAQGYNIKSLESDKVQLFALAFARMFHQLGQGEQKTMFTDFCNRVLRISVVPQGLRRPTIMVPGQTLLEEMPKHPQFQAAIRLLQEEDGRLAEWVLPGGGEEGLMGFICAVFFLQHLIRTLSEPSLFYLMLVLGGLLEYYEQGGKAEDPNSMIEAPKYAFAAAQKYVEEQKKK